jgi:PII-like signaling protein
MLEAQIFIDKDELHGNQLLSEFIMKLLIRNKIIGATAFTAEAGFGKNQIMKNPSRLFSFDESPMVIVVIDKEEKVLSTLKDLRKVYSGGFITTHKVEKFE